MSDAAESWPALSFLEGLRPASGESVEMALLASYSADLGTIGATLLALAGKDSDAGRGSPSDFADAVERLRGNVRIVIQRGRLARMRTSPRIAAVLDQFIREVDFDEAVHSWHPKAALVRTRDEDGRIDWRLWIGSRNLTECVNRDLGLLLTSCAKGGAPIPGVDDLARALAERSALKGHRPGPLAAVVAKQSWQAPAGIHVERIRWSDGSGREGVPVPPGGADDLVVVSPFIDKTFLSRQMPKGAKPARCRLLTTMREIERIGPSLSVFDELLALDAPEYPAGDIGSDSQAPPSDDDVDAAGDEEGETGRGLHAKLLFVRCGRKRTLWLGSANATMRAWTGRNAEVTAELRISELVERGLNALLGSARCVPVPVSEHSPDAAALEEQALERARAQVAARWAVVLCMEDGGMRLVHHSALYPGGPHPEEADIVLEVGALCGDLLIWPPGRVAMDLGSFPPAERSEFVRLRVSRGEKGLSWLQRAPAQPPFGEDRDRAAFVRFLGVRGFLLWVAGLIADDGREGEGDWTVDKPMENGPRTATWTLDSALPTLEEMLAAWSRDPDKFREIERRVSQYLPAVLEQAEEEDPPAAETLRRFGDLWAMLRSGLGVAAIKGADR